MEIVCMAQFHKIFLAVKEGEEMRPSFFWIQIGQNIIIIKCKCILANKNCLAQHSSLG